MHPSWLGAGNLAYETFGKKFGMASFSNSNDDIRGEMPLSKPLFSSPDVTPTLLFMHYRHGSEVPECEAQWMVLCPNDDL